MSPGGRRGSPQSGAGTGARRFIVSAAIGNFVEWYDFTTYAATTAIIAAHFFPSGDPTSALVGAYALFGITYLSRPLGGLVAGWVGDALGRRTALSVTLLFMGAATAAIGLLPTYSSIGVAAPVLLSACRIVQGLGTGGEYASATAFVYEHSADEDRPRYISYLVAVQFAGLLFSVVLASVLSATLGAVAFDGWGWRILFLAAAPFALIGIYLRNRTEETPEFKRLMEEREGAVAEGTPVRTVFRTSWRRMLYFILLVAGFAILTPIQSSYYLTYLRAPGGLSSPQIYAISVVGDIVLIAAAVAAGRVVMRVGLHGTFMISGVMLAVVSVPAFFLGVGGVAAGMVGAVLFAVTKALMAVAGSLAMPSLFRPEIRVTAGGFAYNTATVLFGAAGPTVAVWINATTGDATAFGWVLAIVGLVSALTAALSRRLLRAAGSNLTRTRAPARRG